MACSICSQLLHFSANTSLGKGDFPDITGIMEELLKASTLCHFLFLQAFLNREDFQRGWLPKAWEKYRRVTKNALSTAFPCNDNYGFEICFWKPVWVQTVILGSAAGWSQENMCLIAIYIWICIEYPLHLLYLDLWQWRYSGWWRYGEVQKSVLWKCSLVSAWRLDE